MHSSINLTKLISLCFIYFISVAYGNGNIVHYNASPQVEIDKHNVKWTFTDDTIFCYEGNKSIAKFYENNLDLNAIAIKDNGTVWGVSDWNTTYERYSNAYRFDENGKKTFEKLDGMGNRAAIDSSGNVWFAQTRYKAGSVTAGLYRFNGDERKRVTGSQKIHDVTVSPDNVVWVGTTGSYLLRIEEDSILIIDKSFGLPFESVTAICSDNDGNLWLTNNYELYKYNQSTFTKVIIDSQFIMLKELSVDKDNNLWIITEGRDLIKYNAGILTKYTEKDGLPGNVYDIAIDSNGIGWISTAEGLLWTDFCYTGEIAYVKDYADVYDTIGTNIGDLFAGKILPTYNGESKFTIIDGYDEFKVVTDPDFDWMYTIALKRKLSLTDDTLRATIQAKLNDNLDTFKVVIPVRHWEVTGNNSSYLRMEIPEEETSVYLPEEKSIGINLRLTPINGFSSTVSLSSNIGEFINNNFIVDEKGEVITIFVNSDSLVKGSNIIYIEAKNSGIILGNAVCTLIVDIPFNINDTVLIADTIGDMETISISLNKTGRDYFSKDTLIEVLRYSSDYILTMGSENSNYTNFNWMIEDIASGDTIYQRKYKGHSNEIYNISLRNDHPYKFTTYSQHKSSCYYSGFGIVDNIGNTKKTFNYFNTSTIGNNNYYKNSENFTPKGYEISRDTIRPSDVYNFNITATNPLNSETVLFIGINTRKTLNTKNIQVKLPYGFKILSNNIPIEVIDGEVDTITGNTWLIGKDENNIVGFIDSLWIEHSFSNNINTIAAAPNGLIWIGTKNGGYSYDGLDWKTHSSISDTGVDEYRFDTLGAVYAHNADGTWNVYNAPFWTTGISLGIVPLKSGKISESVNKGYNEVPGMYSFYGKDLFQYVFGEEITAITVDQALYTNMINCNNITICPNPVSVNDSDVKIILPDKNNGSTLITIYDLMGNKIDSGTFQNSGRTIYKWNLRNENGEKVSSANYLAIVKIEKPDGSKIIKKIFIGVKK